MTNTTRAGIASLVVGAGILAFGVSATVSASVDREVTTLDFFVLPR